MDKQIALNSGAFLLNNSFLENTLFVYFSCVRHVLNACPVHKVAGRNIPVGREEVVTSNFIIRIEEALNLLSINGIGFPKNEKSQD